MPYAKGKYALGVCDRTGFVYKLKDLRNQIVDQRRTGLMVGKDVLDKDQPQYQIGRLNIDDPQGLRNARPQKDLEQTRGTYAWDPIGGWNSAYGASNLNNMVLHGHVGKLTITTD